MRDLAQTCERCADLNAGLVRLLGVLEAGEEYQGVSLPGITTQKQQSQPL